MTDKILTSEEERVLLNNTDIRFRRRFFKLKDKLSLSHRHIESLIQSYSKILEAKEFTSSSHIKSLKIELDETETSSWRHYEDSIFLAKLVIKSYEDKDVMKSLIAKLEVFIVPELVEDICSADIKLEEFLKIDHEVMKKALYGDDDDH